MCQDFGPRMAESEHVRRRDGGFSSRDNVYQRTGCLGQLSFGLQGICGGFLRPELKVMAS